MRITTAQLRQIIKEELEKEMGLVDEGLMDKLKGPLIAAGIGAGIGGLFHSLPEETKETIVINGLASYRPTQLQIEIDEMQDQIDDPETPEEQKEELERKIQKIRNALMAAELSKPSPYGRKGNRK